MAGILIKMMTILTVMFAVVIAVAKQQMPVSAELLPLACLRKPHSRPLASTTLQPALWDVHVEIVRDYITNSLISVPSTTPAPESNYAPSSLYDLCPLNLAKVSKHGGTKAPTSPSFDRGACSCTIVSNSDFYPYALPRPIFCSTTDLPTQNSLSSFQSVGSSLMSAKVLRYG